MPVYMFLRCQVLSTGIVVMVFQPFGQNILWEQNSMLWEHNNKLWEQDILLREQILFFSHGLDLTP